MYMTFEETFYLHNTFKSVDKEAIVFYMRLLIIILMCKKLNFNLTS